MKTFSRCVFASTIATLCTLANAQDSNNTIIELQPVEVVGSLNKLGTANPYQAKSTTTLDQAALQDLGVEKMDTIAKYQAGMSNQVFGSDTNTNWFRIRGTAASQSFDGAPAVEYGFFTPHVNSFGLQAVEITKGADSVAYGASNAGGLINYVSKKPDKEQVGHGEINTHVGNANQRGIAADYTGAVNADESLRYRIVGDYHRADGDWYKTYNETYYFAPSVQWDITPNTQLTVLGSVQKDVGTPSSNFLPQDGTLVKTAKGYISRKNNLGDPTQDHESNTATTLGYDFNHDFGDGLSFSQTYRYQHVKNHHQGAYAFPSLYTATYAPLTIAPNYDLSRGVVYNDGKANSHSVDNRINWHLDNGSVENNLVGGVDYRHMKLDADYTLFGSEGTVNVFNPSASYGDAVSITAPKTGITFKQLGVYAQDSLTINKQFNLSAGLRYDRARSREEGGQEVKANHTSYNVSAMYYSPIGLNPYIAYTDAFRLPAGLSGNQALYKPNITKQTEVGVKYAPANADFSASIAYFTAKDKGALVYNGTTATTSSADPIKREGVEIQAQGNFTDNISGQFAYTYLDSKTQTAAGDVRTEGLPRHSLALRGAYTFTDGAVNGLSVGAGIRHQRGSVTDKNSLYGGYKVPSATVVDLFANYNINNNLSAQIGIDNVGNTRYIASCDYYCYYGQERRINAGFKYQW